jgi:2-succinyl-5-enolpyruvyl-6-hydroxy-3-cyclohexene-1-carboxylate synthase
MFTPTTANLRAIAEGYSWKYQLVSTLGQLSEALMDFGRHVVIECTIDR